MTHPQIFLQRYEILQRADIARIQADFDRGPRPDDKKNINRSQQLHRWTQLWLPFRKKLVLGCLLLPPTHDTPAITEVTSPLQMATHISSFWGKCFDFSPRAVTGMTRIYHAIRHANT